MFSALRQVFSNARYLVIASTIALVVYTLALWLPNVRLILDILFSGTVSFSEKLSFLWSLYGSIATNFTLVSATYTILISILFGMSTALITYYIKKRRTLGGSGATLSIGGLISGVFGIGCAACGTFLLTSFLTLFGAANALAFLPFGGEEFGFIGVVLLLYSVYAITNKISKGVVCSV